MWPLPRASQTDEDDEAGGADDSRRPPPAKKAKRGGSMTGHEWATAHGNAWQKFLEEKLKKCECDNPRVSHSHRAKALKEDEGEGVAPGQPAGCLVCFAPIDREVRPSPRPAARAGRLLARAARHVPALPLGAERAGPCSVRAPDSERAMDAAAD